MIVESLGLALPAARTSISAHSAAADAAGRLPQQADQAVVADDLPPLPAPSIRRAVERSAEPLPPTNTVTKKRRRGLVVWLIVILGIPAIVVLAIRLGSEPQDDAAPTSDASDASDSSDAADTSATFEEGASSSTLGLPVPPVLSALTLGLISNGDVALQEAVRTEVAALTADETTFPSGVFLVVQTVGSDTAALLDQLRGQGVNAVISDVTGPAVNDVVSAANAAGVALCLIGASAEVDTVTGPGVAVGTSKSCVDLIGLAAVASDSPDRIRILDAMTQLVAGDGLPCATVAQCGAYLRAEQPITFEPVGELIRLAPDA